MLILVNKDADTAIVVKKQHCNPVGVDTLKKYLHSNDNEDYYCVFNLNKMTSKELISQLEKVNNNDSCSVTSSNSGDFYYKAAQNQILIIEDMDGLVFNSSNDIKRHGDILSRYGSLSKKFIKMLELGYLEKIDHSCFIEITSKLNRDPSKEEDIIIDGSVSDYMDDLSDSGDGLTGAVSIDL